MLMVIFGAGASYDSSPTYAAGGTISPPGATEADAYNAYYRPPLAKELFANRPQFITALDAFEQCKAIVPRLRSPEIVFGRESIEACLQEIEKEAETYPRAHQELAAAQCYIQRALSMCQEHWLGTTRGITNYRSLLREIERTNTVNEPVCLVTFNYDTLLEAGLQHFGYTFYQMADYTERARPLRVFKLHGSIDWGQIVENQVPANIQHPQDILSYLIADAAELRVSDEIVHCDPSRMGAVSGRPIFPAIAIPVEKKTKFACPQRFVERLVQLLPNVTKVLIVGWRATEESFLKILSNRITGLRPSVHTHIVAGRQSDAEETRDRICKTLINNMPLCYCDPSGFTDFLHSGRAKSFLES